MFKKTKVHPGDGNTTYRIDRMVKRMSSNLSSLRSRRKADSPLHLGVLKVKPRLIIEVKGWHSWPGIATVRPWAQAYLMSVPAQSFMVALAALSCSIYVFSTYMSGMGLLPYSNTLYGYLGSRQSVHADDDDHAHGGESGLAHPSLLSGPGLVVVCLFVVDQLTNLCFVLDYLLCCVGSDRMRTYVASPVGVADLLSGFPVSIILTATRTHKLRITGFVRALKFLKVSRLSRLTRLGRIKKSGVSGNEEVYSEVLNGFVVLFVLVFVTVDVILTLEEAGDEWYIGCDDDRGNCGNHLRWHDALYFTIVTLTTVGYGDIGPSNNVSRVFMMVVVLCGFASLGHILANISDAAERSSRWRTWYAPQNGQPHIILAGAPKGYFLKFFSEVFSESQRLEGEPLPCICILSPGDPSDELKLLVGQLYPYLQYIDGSVLVQHDLERARAGDAQAIMVTSSGGIGSGSGGSGSNGDERKGSNFANKRPSLSAAASKSSPSKAVTPASSSSSLRPSDGDGVDAADGQCVLSAISIFRYFQHRNSEAKDLKARQEKERGEQVQEELELEKQIESSTSSLRKTFLTLKGKQRRWSRSFSNDTEPAPPPLSELRASTSASEGQGLGNSSSSNSSSSVGNIGSSSIRHNSLHSSFVGIQQLTAASSARLSAAAKGGVAAGMAAAAAASSTLHHHQQQQQPAFELPSLCFQVVNRATKDHLSQLGMPLNVVATREFRSALTATGALLPGFIAFFGNCLRSNPTPLTSEEDGGGGSWSSNSRRATAAFAGGGKSKSSGSGASSSQRDRWHREYSDGAGHELYVVEKGRLEELMRPSLEGKGDSGTLLKRKLKERREFQEEEEEKKRSGGSFGENGSGGSGGGGGGGGSDGDMDGDDGDENDCDEGEGEGGGGEVLGTLRRNKSLSAAAVEKAGAGTPVCFPESVFGSGMTFQELAAHVYAFNETLLLAVEVKAIESMAAAKKKEEEERGGGGPEGGPGGGQRNESRHHGKRRLSSIFGGYGGHGGCGGKRGVRAGEGAVGQGGEGAGAGAGLAWV